MRVLTIMIFCLTEDKVEKRTEVNPAVVAAVTKIMEEKNGNKILYRRKKVTRLAKKNCIPLGPCYFNKNWSLPPYHLYYPAVGGSNKW